MSFKSNVALLGAMLFAASANKTNPFGGMPVDNTKPYPKAKSLPLWDYNGNKIYAKDETTAIKYAKKRGLYKEGIVPIKCE